MYLAFIQLELFLMQKYTLTNLLSYCKGARLSTDLTCNLAYWHHLIVSMEIDKSYCGTFQTGRVWVVVVNWVVVRLALKLC